MSTALGTANDLVAGSIAGAAQVIVGQPLDTVKTRVQIAPKGMFKGPMDVLMKTVRNEGILALYKGMASPLLGIGAVNSLLFTSYALSRRIVSPFGQLTLPQTALAGSMAGVAQSVLASPIELFKIRMQGQYGGASDQKLGTVAREMWREWGFRKGVMRGFWITVVREIPAYAGFYTGYEAAKRRFAASYGGMENVPIWGLMASGSCGGISYWLACYPLDVLKSRVQLRPTPPQGSPLSYIIREAGAVVAEGGTVGLWRGLVPTLFRTVPAGAATFVAYELSRDALRDFNGA